MTSGPNATPILQTLRFHRSSRKCPFTWMQITYFVVKHIIVYIMCMLWCSFNPRNTSRKVVIIVTKSDNTKTLVFCAIFKLLYSSKILPTQDVIFLLQHKLNIQQTGVRKEIGAREHIGFDIISIQNKYFIKINKLLSLWMETNSFFRVSNFHFPIQ